MIDKKRAHELAQEHLQTLEKATDVSLAIVDVQSHDWGWVYFYQSAKFAETQAIGDMLAGNAPFVISAKSGEITTLGTAKPAAEYILEYAAHQA